MTTIQIDSSFLELFDEFEKKHVALWRELNLFSTDDSRLQDRLSEEIPKFEEWQTSITDDFASVVETFSDEKRTAHKEFIFNTQYYKIIQEAPFYDRIIRKPSGYAGDAVMMHYIYRNAYEGSTPFGMFLHKHALSTKACESVRSRKEYLKKEILNRGSGKFLSVAAGPAREIKEIMEKVEDNHFQFVALDHDLDTLRAFNMPERENTFKYALANAFQIIAGNYRIAKPRNAWMSHCYPSRDFKGWRRIFCGLKYELLYLEKKQFDFVYSAGLYDYIRTYILDDTKGTLALTKNLFDLVKPGGALLVGNFNYNNPRGLRFVMDYVLGWELIYRERRDMVDLTRAIDEKQIESMEIIEEPLGINYFLKIVKRDTSVHRPPPVPSS